MRSWIFRSRPGGNIGTAPVTLTRLGVSVGYVGKMEDNHLARGTLEALREQGVHVERVLLHPNTAGCELAIVVVDRQTGGRRKRLPF
ncbi:MAG: hypothetical protein J7M27_03890 [Candidatus Latescibacteria bacterium]|nr:hypothetical protein [Candidatus Latescibacterota bacterium]